MFVLDDDDWSSSRTTNVCPRRRRMFVLDDGDDDCSSSTTTTNVRPRRRLFVLDDEDCSSTTTKSLQAAFQKPGTKYKRPYGRVYFVLVDYDSITPCTIKILAPHSLVATSTPKFLRARKFFRRCGNFFGGAKIVYAARIPPRPLGGWTS